MTLHDTRVVDARARGGGGAAAETTVGFLHYDGEDEAVVYTAGLGDLLDAGFDVVGFGGRVLGLSCWAADLWLVGIPPDWVVSLGFLRCKVRNGYLTFYRS